MYKKNIVYTEDKTNGLLKLVLAKRTGDARDYYIRNNLDGRFIKGNVQVLEKVAEIFCSLLPPKVDNEILVGFAEGSLILTALLAYKRKSSFACSTKTQKSNMTNEINF